MSLSLLQRNIAGNKKQLMQETIKKFRFKNNATVINAPALLEKEFEKLGFTFSFDKKVKSANTLVFISNKKEFVEFLKTNLQNLEYDSVLWFAYPKGTSKIKTDINRDIIRITAEEFGITTVTAVAIDDTWGALRLRPVEKVGK